MGVSAGPNIIRDSSLVLDLDAFDQVSMPGDPTINNIINQSASLYPAYTSTATMSISWSSGDTSWYVTFKSGSTDTLYKGMYIKFTSPYIVLEPTSSRIAYSYKAIAITDNISMSMDTSNYALTGSVTGSYVGYNDSQYNISYYPGSPYLLTTSSIATSYTQYTVQTASVGMTGSNYYTFNNIYVTNGFPITKDLTIKIWDIQHEIGNYPSPFTATSRSVWYDRVSNNNFKLLNTNTSFIPKYDFLNQKILNFDGSGSYALIDSVSFNCSPITIAIYYKKATLNQTMGLFFADANWGGGGRSHRILGDAIQLYSNNGTVTSVTNAAFANALSTLDWTQICYTVTGSIVNAYVNGINQIRDYILTSSMNTSSAFPIQLGKLISGTTDFYFSGSIGSVLIYNRVLSDSEVSQNYNAIKTRYR